MLKGHIHFLDVYFHSVFYLVKKELCSENILELDYKIVTGFFKNNILTLFDLGGFDTRNNFE